jgi:RNA-binding protein 23/39
MRREAERAQREQERQLKEFDRLTRTIYASNLSLKAEEKDLFAFFARAGPIVDIRIIRDKTTGRSKGIAYVEYQHKESVMSAFSLTGQPLLGVPAMVQLTNSEKNLAWEQAEKAKAQQKKLQAEMATAAAAAMGQVPGVAALGMHPAFGPPGFVPGVVPGVGAALEGPCRLLISPIAGDMDEAALRSIFGQLGDLDLIVVQRDAAGNHLGAAYIQYKLTSAADKAIEGFDNFSFNGVAWRVVKVPLDPLPNVVGGAAAAPPAAPEAPVMEERIDNDAYDGGGMRLTAQSRMALMSRLAATAGLEVPAASAAFAAGSTNPNAVPLGVPGLYFPGMQPQQAQQAQVPPELQMQQGVLGPASPIPTQCLLLKNMFDPAEETDADWDEAIGRDVKEECEEKYGPVEHVFVDVTSKVRFMVSLSLSLSISCIFLSFFLLFFCCVNQCELFFLATNCCVSFLPHRTHFLFLSSFLLCRASCTSNLPQCKQLPQLSQHFMGDGLQAGRSALTINSPSSTSRISSSDEAPQSKAGWGWLQ